MSAQSGVSSTLLRGGQVKYHHIGIPTDRPREGVTAAFIVDNGAPVEFLQIDRSATGEGD